MDTDDFEKMLKQAAAVLGIVLSIIALFREWDA
jgi:hypothetical protein